MADYLPPARKRKYDETISADTTHSSFSTASTNTKRRKLQRRLHSYSNETREVQALTAMFQHIKVLGRVPAYSKLNPELVIAPADPIIEEFTLLDPPPIPDLKTERFTFVKACTPVEMAHLKHFDREPHLPAEDTQEALNKAAMIVADLLSLPEFLHFPERYDIAKVKYYPKKFAGIDYARMGLKTREEADPIAQADAEKAYDDLLSGKHVQPHDVRLGGRGKVAEMTAEQSKSDPPPVGRLILMLSHRDLKLCGITENQLTASYSAEQFPIAVGQSWYHGGSNAFLHRMRDYKRWFCFDAKKFDSGINPWMVRLAINILREQYFDGDNPKYDAYWEFVYQSLVRAPIYRDDGIRLQKEVGTTSGHSHNTLIQSIITLLIGYATMALLHPEASVEELRAGVWLESLGDDNAMAARNGFELHTVEEIAETMWRAFRIDWGGKKSFATDRLLDPSPGDFQGMQFLGKYFYLADYPTVDGVARVPLPYRPAQETYLRLLYPEYGTLEKTQTYLRVLGNYIDAAGNRLMEEWLQRLMDWMDVEEERVPPEWPSNFKRMVTRDYSNVGVEVPIPARLSFEQWRDLVVLGKADYREQWPRTKTQQM